MSSKWTLKDVEKVQSNIPVKKKHAPALSANTLTKHALRMLDLNGFNVWRQNNVGVYDPVKKVFRKNSTTPGISDILGYHRKSGRIIACEIKAGNDRLSADQEMFLNGIKRAGGIALVVRKIDDLLNFQKDETK